MPFVIQVVLFFWNAVHVGRQSCGILSIYRHRAGVADPGQKQAANAAILATNLWFCLWNIETHQEVEPVLAAISPRLPFLLWLALVGYLAWCERRWLARIVATVPELRAALVGFAVLAVLGYALNDSGIAIPAVMLTVLNATLIWLVHRRKFRVAVRSRAEAYLHRVSANNTGLVLALAASGLVFFAAKELLARVGYLALFESAYLLLAFVHFYVDGLYWAFRDPHVRRSLGPYLMQGSPAVAGVR